MTLKIEQKTETQHFRRLLIFKLVKFQNASINDPVFKYDTSSSKIKSIFNIKTGNLNKWNSKQSTLRHLILSPLCKG